MSLRFKSFIIIISFVTILSVFFSVTYYYVFLNYSGDTEERFAEDSIERINTSLNIEIKDFAYKCNSFSDWVKTYNFINSPNKKYIDENLKESDYENFGFNFVAISDLKGNIIYADSYDYLLKLGLKSIIRNIFNHETIKGAAENLEEVSGIIKIKNEIYIISFNPVKENKYSAEPNGYFIAGKNIKNANIFKVRYDPDYLSFSLFTDDMNVPDFNDIRAEVLLNNLAVRQDNDMKGLHSYFLVRDISGKPAILLTLYQQSNIYDISRKATIFIIFTSIAVIFILISVFILIFKKFIIAKIAKLNENINIFISGSKSDMSLFDRKNTDKKTDDEIDNLGANIQKMLRIINYRYTIEKLFTDITHSFLRTDNKTSEVISFINLSLEKIGSFTGADRAFIGIIDKVGKKAFIKYEWVASGIEPMTERFDKYSFDNIMWIADRLQKDGISYIKSAEEADDNKNEILKFFRDLNIKSNILVNLHHGNENFTGFMGINTAIEEKIWHDEEIELIKNSADVYSKAISLINIY